jgi:solute carrier family 45, member 1/2/4
MCQKLTAKVVWVISSVMICIVMALVTILSAWSLGDIGGSVQDAATEKGLRGAALALFVFLGFPFAVSKKFSAIAARCMVHSVDAWVYMQQVLCSVPFAVTAQLAESQGGGQGLCVGVLNISIVVPQMIIAVGSGPWDLLFGKGNIPVFGAASVFAFAAAVAGIVLLPKMSKTNFRSVSMGGGH